MHQPKPLIKESFLVTLLTLVVALLIFYLPLKLKIFDPVKKTFKKIDLLDVYYSHIRANQTDYGPQKNVVLLNIAKLERDSIGYVLKEVNQYEPKVIALDVHFFDARDEVKDSVLKTQLIAMKSRLVLASMESDGKVIGTNTYFGSYIEGYSNLISEGDPSYSPVRKVQLIKEGHKSFSYRVVERFKPKELQKLEGQNDFEKALLINYYGNYNRFLNYEYDEVMKGGEALKAIEGKIVVVGDYGNTFSDKDDIEDRYHTPMNAYGASKGLPDMKGALIHANIIQMIIDGSIITVVPDYINLIGAAIVTFPIIIMFSYFFVRRHLWFHIVAKGVQIVLALVLILLIILLYAHSQLKFDPKYLLLFVIVSVDVLYLYEAIVVVRFKRTNKKSYFIHEHD